MRSRLSWFGGLGWSAELLLISACGSPTELPPAAVMLGAWTYDSAPIGDHAPSLNTGFHVTLAVDSAEGMQFSGRVTRWLAGDVRVPADAFRRLTGGLDGAGGLTITVPRASGSTLTITGDLSGDIITIHESWAGAEPGPFPSGESFRRSPE